MIGLDFVTEGPSDAALDQEEYIKDLWQNYESEIKEMRMQFNEISVYGKTIYYDPSDRIYSLARKAMTKVQPNKPPANQNTASMLSIDFDYEMRDQVSENLN